MWQRIIHNWRLVTVAVLATAVVAVSPVQATTVTSANDYVTSLETSAAGNHTVIFTTPNSLVAGETITLTFDSSFDTSSITEDDIDFEDDDVDETTVSTCTGGGDEILFGIASDVVTLTLCAGHSGMSSSSVIRIEIGDHATAGGT